MSSIRKNKRMLFNRAFGRRSAKEEPQNLPAIPNPNAYPVRHKPLGRSSGSVEGVAGWRSNYYKLDEIK